MPARLRGARLRFGGAPSVPESVGSARAGAPDSASVPPADGSGTFSTSSLRKSNVSVVLIACLLRGGRGGGGCVRRDGSEGSEIRSCGGDGEKEVQ